MTRGELSDEVKRMFEVHNGKFGHQALCRLLDCAIEVGHAQARGRIEKALGPAVAAIVDIPNGWHEILDMECHLPPLRAYQETPA